MSAIALAWVAKTRVGNQTAKQLLHFLAAQNFTNPDFLFRNETLAEQLEVTVRSIQKAFNLLIEKKLISKAPRYNGTGRQLSNQVVINIPQEFIDEHTKDKSYPQPVQTNYKMGELDSGGGRTTFTPRDEPRSPLYNNNLNNKYNNTCATDVARMNFEQVIEKLKSEDQEIEPPYPNLPSSKLQPPSAPPGPTRDYKDYHGNVRVNPEKDLFSKFYAIYPRKRDRAGAERIWKQNNLDKLYDTIISAVKNTIQNDKSWSEKQKIPYAKTYLLNQRWEDEITPPSGLGGRGEWGRGGSIYTPVEMKSTVKEYGPGHPAWEANQKWKQRRSASNVSQTQMVARGESSVHHV